MLIFVTLVCALNGIEVGGHISRSTTWSPESSPYIITSFLYIDSQVTLTIMPGTQILCSGADKSDIFNFMWSGNNQPISKMIIVSGTINAVGSYDLPISFDKYQTDSNYRWGGVYIMPDAPISTFEHCEFRNAFFCDYVPGEWSLAAIAFENGLINVRSCTFENNYYALGSGNQMMDLVIYNCKFLSFNDTYPAPFAYASAIAIGPATTDRNYQLTIAKCYFSGNFFFVSPGYSDRKSVV